MSSSHLMRLLARIPAAFAILALSANCATGQAGATQSSAPDRISTQDITIKNGDITLAASILKPAASNGIGVVMLAGSGPADRSMIRPSAEELAKLGYTVLIYDKRGAGESTGNWVTSSLDDLASDATAAMSALSEQRFSLGHIGYWMHSQGNWVATRAIEQGAEPAFLIAISGGGASPRDTETYAYRFKVSRYLPAEQEAAMQLVDNYFAYLSGEISSAEFDALIAKVEELPWYESLGLSRVLVSEANRPNWQWVADYDPADLAAQRDVPTLVLLGGLDHTIPLGLTVSGWNEQLTGLSGKRNRIEVLVGREHHMNSLDPNASGGHGFHGMTADPEFWEIIDHWLSQEIQK